MVGASIGDTHLGVTLKGYDLTPSTRKVLFTFARLCERERVGYAVHLGDMFDSCRPATVHLKLAMQWSRWFGTRGIRLFILTGNHDVLNRPGSTSALDPLKAAPLRGVQVVDRPMAVKVSGDTALALLPFPSPTTYNGVADWAAQVEAALTNARRLARFVIVYGHLEVDGAKAPTGHAIPAGDFRFPQRLCKGLVAFNGHHHMQQVSLASGSRVYMQGASQRTDFGERIITPQFYLIGARGRVLAAEAAPAVQMKQVNLDLTSVTRSGRVVSTRQVIATLGRFDGMVVKVIPVVDDSVVVDWTEVVSAIIEAGALHVYPIVPIRKVVRPTIRRGVTDVSRLAQSWISAKVKSKGERIALWRLFKQLRTEARQ